MHYGLTQDSLNGIIAVFDKMPQVQEVVLFGSRAMNRYHNGSDIDLAVKGNLSYNDIVWLYILMDDLFLPYQFDIVDYHAIESRPVLDHIDRVGIRIYHRNINK